MQAHKVTKAIKKGIPFLVGITGFYIFFSVILEKIDLYFLKSYNAIAANFLLNLFGVNSSVKFLAEPTIFVSGIQAQITELCAGDLEIALITAIILATWDTDIRKRIVGVVGAWFTILILNPVRIFIVLLSGAWFSWQVGDFIHTVLFRIMLLIVIAVYYYVWYVRYNDVKNWMKSKIKNWKEKEKRKNEIWKRKHTAGAETCERKQI